MFCGLGLVPKTMPLKIRSRSDSIFISVQNQQSGLGMSLSFVTKILKFVNIAVKMTSFCNMVKAILTFLNRTELKNIRSWLNCDIWFLFSFYIVADLVIRLRLPLKKCSSYKMITFLNMLLFFLTDLSKNLRWSFCFI